MRKFKITCPVCGKTVIRQGHTKRPPIYCSRKCYFASPSRKQRSDKGKQVAPRITVRCKECGKELHVTQSVIDSGRGRFCSASCSARYYSKRRPPPKSKGRPKRRIELTCKICKQKFEVKPYRVKQNAQFCSHECANKVRGSAHYLYKEKVQRSCVICGATVYVHPCRAETFKCCSRECLSIYALSNLVSKTGPTSIEQLLLEELNQQSVSCKPQYTIDKWCIDIALPEYKIAIEADGDYWHSLPARKKKDIEKDTYLTQNGWTVFRFWGSEIRESPSACIDKVLDYINNL